MSEIDPDHDTVVHCKMGGRSAMAIDALKRSGFTGKLLNLKGGITAFHVSRHPLFVPHSARGYNVCLSLKILGAG